MITESEERNIQTPNDNNAKCEIPFSRRFNLDFGQALRALKMGHRIARRGWNGSDMWLAYSPGHPGLPAEKFWSDANRGYALLHGGRLPVQACITMKNAQGDIVMGWLASQTDMFAEDWYIVE